MSDNKAVFTVGSWSFGRNAATPGRQYRPSYTAIVLHISEGLICLILLQDTYRFQIGTLWKSFVTNLMYDLISLIRDRKKQTTCILFCVIRFYKLLVMWHRKMVSNYFVL